VAVVKLTDNAVSEVVERGSSRGIRRFADREARGNAVGDAVKGIRCLAACADGGRRRLRRRRVGSAATPSVELASETSLKGIHCLAARAAGQRRTATLDVTGNVDSG